MTPYLFDNYPSEAVADEYRWPTLALEASLAGPLCCIMEDLTACD